MKKLYKVLGHLITYGYISEQIAKEMYEIDGISQIISTLRDRGFKITTEKKNNGTGYKINLDEDISGGYSLKISQEDLIYMHLNAYGNISNDEAYEKYGVAKLSTVITRIRGKYKVNISVYKPVQESIPVENRGYIYVLMKRDK